MTFGKYITRKQGFGKTSWPMAILIHLFSVVATMMLVMDGNPIWIPLSVSPTALLWFGTYMNYKGKWV
jgi:hypothetical protein